MDDATPSLLEDFLSGETGRIMHATWVVVGSRDPDQLDPLVPAAGRIRAAVDRVDLGGFFRSNRGNVDCALQKLDDYARGACWCETYIALDQFEPEKEQVRGHARILSTSEPGWSMTYEVECAVCGRVFDVEQGDHHIMWWKWVPRGEKRTATRAPA